MGTDLTKLQWKEITDSVVLEIEYGKSSSCNNCCFAVLIKLI